MTMPDALCVGKSDIFESRAPRDQREARALCLQCPLQQACLERAFELRKGHEEVWGTWGGVVFHGRKKPTVVRERVSEGPKSDWPRVGKIHTHGRAGYRLGCTCQTCRGEEAAFSAHRRHRSKGFQVKDDCKWCQEREGLVA